MIVIGCDLGGTHTRLKLAECAPGVCTGLHEQDYPSSAYAGLAPILEEFIASYDGEVPSLHSACIAVAGPIQTSEAGQTVNVTNLPWTLDSAELAAALGTERIALINDFQAIGHGVAALQASDLVPLQEGRARAAAPRAVLGAGTGLGQALLVWRDDHYEVLPTEGGHVDFAPTDDLQMELLRQLRPRLGRVAYENLLSGSGLERIFQFLCAHNGVDPTEPLRKDMERHDPAAAISEHGLAGRDRTASEALDIFVRIYGAQAGNLALNSLPYGGLYIAGGIAPKIVGRMTHGPFLETFQAKGGMRALMQSFPVHLVNNTRVGLEGAVQYASRI